MLPLRGTVPDPRASLRFFTLSAFCFAILGLMLPLAAGHIEVFRHHPRLLVAVHAFTLGLTALEMGAFYQLVPVMLEQPAADRRQAMIQARVLGAGVLLVLAGFYRWRPVWLAAGGTLVAVAVLWFAALVGPGVIRARRQGLAPAYLIGALLSLLVLVGLGVTLALNLRYHYLPGGGWDQLAAHLVLGAGGWFGLAIIGLSYRLAGMFYLTPRGEPPAWARWLAWLTVAAVAVLALLLLVGVTRAGPPLTALAALLGLVYAADFGLRLRRRRRQVVDPTICHLYASVLALLMACIGMLAVGVSRLAGGAGWMPAVGGWTALALLLLPGWAGNIAMGLSYKIMPFLVWYQRFAPAAGTRPVPTLAQLLPRRLPWIETVAWNLGLAALLVLTLTGAAPAWKMAAGAVAGAGALCFAANALYVLWRR